MEVKVMELSKILKTKAEKYVKKYRLHKNSTDKALEYIKKDGMDWITVSNRTNS